jgi:branched-chain amino acid transport system substrate-binding protein
VQRLARACFVGALIALWLLPAVPPVHASPATLRIGAVFPLSGQMAPLARQEYRGVQIAADLINAAGGIAGRRIVLVTRELDQPGQANAVMQALRRAGITTVIGAYSSALSIPAAAAAARRGMVYWEAGAVADRLTGQGYPTVFRVGADGSDLGTNSAGFIAHQLAARLHEPISAVRISVVSALDEYAQSVAVAAVRQAKRSGMRVVSWSRYDPYAPDWTHVIRQVRVAHPDILILASHIADGVAFRRAFVEAHVYVKAFIGSTMAQCVPEFGALMGKEAIGVFASDRPPGFFNPGALDPAARSLFDRFSALWYRQTGERQPNEEGLAGFSAAWVLFHDVLPRAAGARTLDPSGIAAAARSINLPDGSLPNGAGIRFATDRAHLGQNLRAAAVIWQWQAVRHSVVVWPAQYATGHIRMVPLPR